MDHPQGAAGPKDPSCGQRRSEPAHHGTSKTAPRHTHTSVRTGRAVIGTRNGNWGLSRPRAGDGSGRFGMGVCGSRTRAADRRRTWTRISGGYCSGMALGRDIGSGTVAESSDDGFVGRSLRILFPEAIFLRALRTEAMLLNKWCLTGGGAGMSHRLHVTFTGGRLSNLVAIGTAIALLVRSSNVMQT